MKLVVNSSIREVDASGDMPLLWVLRDLLHLTGVKYGCGIAQCGSCKSGQIMSAVALLAENPATSDADIDVALAGNICRCGTYQRIREAVHRAAALNRRVQR